MKRILVFSLICAGIIVLSLFLPYVESYYQIHRYTLHGGNMGNTQELNNGWENLPWSVIPAFVILLIAGIIKVKQNLTTAIIGLIISILNLLSMAILAFALTFHFDLFGPSRTTELRFGYFVSLWIVLIYIVLMLIHLVMIVRNRNKPENIASPQLSDLLDDEL